MAPASSRSDKKVTLADIARASGVSTATVSLVLRDKPGVGEETRQRVLDSAQALGYVYTPSNQAVRRALPDDFGVIIKSRPNDLPASNSFYAAVLAGVETICRRHQINLMYANLLVDSVNNPVETPRLMLDGEVDGLLLVGMNLNEGLVDRLRRIDAPVVLVDAYAEGDPFDAVVTDNVAGAYRATQYLIGQGHRHIGIVGSLPDAYPSVRERREGYLQALADHGLEPYFADCVLHPSVVEPCVTDLLTAHPEITAIFGCNDDVAIAAMRAAQQLGRRIPGDLSVVGFDNIDLSQAVLPRLTTMRVDMMGMGRLAAQLLMNRIEYPEAGLMRAVVCPSLVERDSVAPC
jgi:LacI family transcriptional regulator